MQGGFELTPVPQNAHAALPPALQELRREVAYHSGAADKQSCLNYSPAVLLGTVLWLGLLAGALQLAGILDPPQPGEFRCATGPVVGMFLLLPLCIAVGLGLLGGARFAVDSSAQRWKREYESASASLRQRGFAELLTDDRLLGAAIFMPQSPWLPRLPGDRLPSDPVDRCFLAAAAWDCLLAYQRGNTKALERGMSQIIAAYLICPRYFNGPRHRAYLRTRARIASLIDHVYSE